MLESAALASECRFAACHDMNVAVAARLWEIVDAAVETRGRAELALAGGSTPVPVYNLLREMPLPWDRLTLCPSDERWVPADDAASNEGMLLREMGPSVSAAEFISMARCSDDLEADAAACNRRLARRRLTWDVVVLGMGTDGHTASWFPGATGLDAALNSSDHCVAVTPATTPQARLSLTRHSILAARAVVLVMSGQRKWQVYREALTGSDTNRLPVRAILHQDRTPVEVFWCAN